MKILYSNMLPMRLKPGQETFIDYFFSAVQKSDEIEIAVGYVSKASVRELKVIAEEGRHKKLNLTIGMYYIEGMPEGAYHEAMDLNDYLLEHGIGEVRIIRAFKYHGKIYTFYKDGLPISAIIGSNNLGAIKLEASNRRQYEAAVAEEDPEIVAHFSEHIHELNLPKCSVNIRDSDNMPIIREVNRALVDQEFVSKVTQEEVEAYQKCRTGITFEIPLKVPEDENDPRMRGSNINVCYASGRKRVWWESEIVVSKTIRDLPGYPEFQKPFMAVTDDGWKFQVWTCGQGNKNLYSKDDLKIMGRWIKGRLVAAGLVAPVNQVETDNEGKGVITRKMLQKYGRETITLTKTSLTTKTDDGQIVDIWTLSFLPETR